MGMFKVWEPDPKNPSEEEYTKRTLGIIMVDMNPGKHVVPPNRWWYRCFEDLARYDVGFKHMEENEARRFITEHNYVRSDC